MSNRMKSLNINGISYELKDDIAREQLKGKLDVLSLAEAWTEGKSYKIGDFVSFNGAYYRCVKATNSFSPESDEYWTKLSLDMIAMEKGMLVNEFEAKTAGSYEVGEIVSYEGFPYKRNSTVGDDTSWDAAHWDIATNTDLATRFKGLKLDGSVTDEFVARCLEKPVAISAMRYALNSGATIQDRAINLVTMTDTRQTLTLPSRIVGKTRDLILRVEVGDLATIGGIALALGSTELASWEGDALDFAANKNYLVTVTETKNTAATDAQDAPTFFVRVVEMTAQPTAA